MDYVQVIGVDNVLNKVLDPIQVGYTASKNLMCSLKCVPKRDATEKVGVVAKKNGLYHILEYSEIPESLAAQTAYDGSLLFKHGSILVFMVNTKYLLDLVLNQQGAPSRQKTLYHKAYKKVEHVDPNTWETITPTEENAWKFELFIHSFLPNVEEGKLGVVMCDRDTEFAAVKNPNGDDSYNLTVDSPAYCRKMLLQESANWLMAVSGLKIDYYAMGNIEVSPLLSYSGENLMWLKHIYKKSSLGAPGGYLDHQGEYT